MTRGFLLDLLPT